MSMTSQNPDPNKKTAASINSAASKMRSATRNGEWKSLLKNKQLLSLVGGLSLLVLFVIGGSLLWGKINDNNNSATASTISRYQVGETFELSGVHPKTRESVRGKIHMTVKEIRKSDKISVQSEAVNLSPNQAFLTIDLELENKNSQQLGFFSRDYFRLMIDGKPFAPQFYNEGVNVAPVSVRNDRVAFLIRKEDTQFAIQIGDLTEPSETLEITLEK